MTELERMFRDLAGRDATAKEIERLRRIKDTMRLNDNDAVWWVIILTFSQIASVRNVVRQIERGAERYANVIENAGAKTAEILNEARSELRATAGAPGEYKIPGAQIGTFLVVIFIIVAISYGAFQLGHFVAVNKVRGFGSEIATRIFDAPGLSASDYRLAGSENGRRALSTAHDGRLDFLETAFGRVAFKAHRDGVRLVFADMMTCRASGTVLGSDGTCEGHGMTWRSLRD